MPKHGRGPVVGNIMSAPSVLAEKLIATIIKQNKNNSSNSNEETKFSTFKFE